MSGTCLLCRRAVPLETYRSRRTGHEVSVCEDVASCLRTWVDSRNARRYDRGTN